MIEIIKFPAGEVTARVSDIESPFLIHCDFRSYDDIFVALSTANAVRHARPDVFIRLLIPYFPSSRQDRVTNVGHSFDAQVVAGVLSSGDFDEIVTWDAHSDVLGALFAPGHFVNVPQHELLAHLVDDIHNPVLISPDAGAEKKTHKLSEWLDIPMLQASKVRDTETGALSGAEIPYDSRYDQRNMVIVDDICDGGRTFINLADVIREQYNVESLHLVVTHGIFSKGKQVLLDVFDSVQALNDFTMAIGEHQCLR